MKTTVHMFAKIRCNRPVDLEKDWIVPGEEYAMIMDGRSICFTIDTILVGVDSIDPKILYIESAAVDFDGTFEMLRNISKIEDFCFYAEPDNTDLEMVSIEEIGFRDNQLLTIVVPDVIRAYNAETFS